MAKKLVIVESPAKVQTLKKFLGSDYEVEASYGHVRDLNNKTFGGFGIDIKNGYTPDYKNITDKIGKYSKTEQIKKLKDRAKSASEVLLASDPDREGEAIAWHLSQIIANKNIKRITFNEITKKAVLEAIKNPRDIDMNLFYSQQARRVLDRLVGYTVSPVLNRKISKGLSAGRVQSPALILLADREKEVRAFIPEDYWDVFAHVLTHKKDKYVLKLEKIGGKKERISKEDDAIRICDEIEKAWDSGDVTVVKNKVKRSPSPPFITSTLQRSGNTVLGWTAEFTMSVAQKLYEAGYITYMRTDSVRINDDTLKAIADLIKNDFGDKYYKHRAYTTKEKAQDAHEAVRPTDVSVEKISGVSSDEAALYNLIWKRTIACQMSDAILDETVVKAIIDKYELSAKGLAVDFDGYGRVWGFSEMETLTEIIDGIKNNILKTTEKEKKTTKAPPRYSDARLIEVLEKEGVGRPSTYAAIIKKLVERHYVIREGSGKKATLQVSDLGIQVSDYLKETFTQYVSMGFTSQMETDLDGVEEGKTQWVTVVDKYYPDLKKQADTLLKQKEIVGEQCPDCGKDLVFRIGRSGKFIGCSGYSKCKFTREVDGNKHPELQEDCPDCGSKLLYRRGKFGDFIGCSAYPKCKYIKREGPKCPDCSDGVLMKRFSKKTKKPFMGCSNYPKCSYLINVGQFNKNNRESGEQS